MPTTYLSFLLEKCCLTKPGSNQAYYCLQITRHLISSTWCKESQAYYCLCQQDYQTNSTWWQITKYAIVFITRLLLELKIAPSVMNNQGYTIVFTQDFLVDLIAPPGGVHPRLCEKYFFHLSVSWLSSHLRKLGVHLDTGPQSPDSMAQVTSSIHKKPTPSLSWLPKFTWFSLHNTRLSPTI